MTANHHPPKGAPKPPHVPTRQEARALAAGKIGLPHIVLDRGDLGMMTAICSDIADAAVTDRQRELATELRGFLIFLRLQLN
jgi:hypothetical protein